MSTAQGKRIAAKVAKRLRHTRLDAWAVARSWRALIDRLCVVSRVDGFSIVEKKIRRTA